jgi:hypothetical protein
MICSKDVWCMCKVLLRDPRAHTLGGSLNLLVLIFPFLITDANPGNDRVGGWVGGWVQA